MSGVPILVEARDVRVLVVGGGTVAARKARALAEAGATVRVVSPAAADEICEMARDGVLELVSRTFVAGDVLDAQLVIAATNDRATNAAVAAEARDAHRLVNVVDAPEEGSFATMATHRTGALVVGVSAGGVPAGAARVRDAIAARFDERYGRALASLAAVRRELLDRGESERWHALAGEVLGATFCDAVETDGVEARVSAWR